MNGDPLDPITFEEATKQLWASLAAQAGLNLQEHLLCEDNDPSPEWRERDLRLQSLWSEARDMLLAIIISRARWWTADGGTWRRPPPETIMTIIRTKGPDEPWGVFVDRREVASVLATLRPDLDTAPQPEGLQKATAKRPAKKPGRKKGPGFNPKDVSLFEMILAAQRQSGDVETQYALVRRFAPKGPFYNANVDRLRHGLPNWLEQNGHQWKRSN